MAIMRCTPIFLLLTAAHVTLNCLAATPLKTDVSTQAATVGGGDQRSQHGAIGLQFAPDADKRGLKVVDIYKNSPADKAGLKFGDLVVAVNQKQVTRPSDIARIMDSVKLGTEVTISYLRNGEIKNAQVAVVGSDAIFNEQMVGQSPEAFLPFAEKGDADAQAKLGLLYREGNGAPKNEALSAHWYRKAAEQGLALAQFDLGSMYSEGRGLPQDNTLAASWFRKAADQGFARAQTALGSMYAEGKGVPKDSALARLWLEKAADRGDSGAFRRLRVIARQQVAEREKMAGACADVMKRAGPGQSQNALGAGLSFALGVAADSAGNLLIADSGNNRILKLCSGRIFAVAGRGSAGFSGDGGLARDAELREPHGVAVDTTGSIYVADTGNHRIRKVDTDGVITTVAGGGFSFPGQAGPARGLALGSVDSVMADDAGNVLVTTDGFLLKIDRNGMSTPLLIGSVRGARMYISHVAGDADGNIYVSAGAQSNLKTCILRRSSNGEVKILAGCRDNKFTYHALAADDSGNLYFSASYEEGPAGYYGESRRTMVGRLDSTNNVSTLVASPTGYSGDGGLASKAEIGAVYGLAVDGGENLYFSDNGVCIRRINRESTITMIAGLPQMDGNCIKMVREFANLALRITIVERAKQRASSVWTRDDWSHYSEEVKSFTTSVSELRGSSCAPKNEFWDAVRRSAAERVGHPGAGPGGYSSVGGYSTTGSASTDAQLRADLLARIEAIRKQVLGEAAPASPTGQKHGTR